MAGEKAATRYAEAVTKDCAVGRWPYSLIALQLQSDYQIRANSPYRHLRDMLDEVFASFARHAPAETRLVVKLHPLDNSLERWPHVVPEAARRHGLDDRVILIDGGNLDLLLQHAQGCVIVNSTVGLRSIQIGCPTKVLGIAVFDIAGLTHQGALESFWQNPGAVDPTLARDLVAALAATIQIKGSFYHPEGRKLACAAIVQRVAEGNVNQPGAFVDPPPRLARARAMAIAV
jgi:capsular polysaccharide export protein